MIIPIFYTLRDAKEFSPGHTARKWWRWDLNPDTLQQWLSVEGDFASKGTFAKIRRHCFRLAFYFTIVLGLQKRFEGSKGVSTYLTSSFSY